MWAVGDWGDSETLRRDLCSFVRTRWVINEVMLCTYAAASRIVSNRIKLHSLQLEEAFKYMSTYMYICVWVSVFDKFFRPHGTYTVCI